MNTKCETSERRLPGLVWLVYQALAWFYALAIIFSLYMSLFYGKQEYVEGYKHLSYIEHSIEFIFLIACIGAITRRSWAAHWVRVTGIWLLTLFWSNVPGLFESTIQEILYGAPEVIGGGPNLTNKPYPSYVYLLAKIIGFLLLLTLIIISHVISVQRAKTASRKEGAGPIKNGRLLYIGILVILLGLAFKWLDLHIEQQIYAMTIGSYLVVGGAVLILIWHILVRSLFVGASVASISTVLFIYKPPFASSVLTFVLWGPAIAMGAVNLFRKNWNAKLRTAIIGLPIVFMLTAFSPSVVQIPVRMHFWVYYKETSQRPADFPEYLQVPSGATNVRYRGGDNPHLSFTLEEPYPATATFNFITSNLEQAGWKKLDYNLMNPEFKSSHLIGWYSPLTRWFDLGEDTKKKIKNSRWMADWINNKNETLSMHLEYSPPKEDEEKLTILYCNLSQHSAEGWMRMYVENYKRFHKSENE